MLYFQLTDCLFLHETKMSMNYHVSDYLIIKGVHFVRYFRGLKVFISNNFNYFGERDEKQ